MSAAKVLQELNKRNMAQYEALFHGRRAEVLFEEKTVKDGREYYSGHTREYILVTVPAGDCDLRNKICDCIL